MSKLPWMCILWPSFLAASGLEMLVFAVVDPAELRWAHSPHAWSNLGIYSIAFFLFWLLTLLSSASTALLGQADKEETETR